MTPQGEERAKRHEEVLQHAAFGRKITINASELADALEALTRAEEQLALERSAHLTTGDCMNKAAERIAELEGALQYVLEDEPTGVPRADSKTRQFIRAVLARKEKV